MVKLTICTLKDRVLNQVHNYICNHLGTIYICNQSVTSLAHYLAFLLGNRWLQVQPFFGFIGDYITPLLTLSKWVLFLPSSDVYVRSFLYLLYTLLKLYYTKALSGQVSGPGLNSPLEAKNPGIFA